MPIRLTRDEKIATLTLDSPKTLNALDDELVQEAIRQLRAVFAADDIEALILTGANGVFSAGGNLQMLSELNAQLQANPNAAQELAQTVRNGATIIELLKASPIPTIAAIDGACAGASIGWVGACDLRIASETAFFDTAYLKLGLSSDFGVSYVLHETVGLAVTKDWLLRPRRILASEAYTRGFVTELTPDQPQLMETASEIAHFLSSERHLGVQALRDNITEVHQDISLADHLEHEAQRFINTLSSPDIAARIANIVAPRN